jgi:hypothetical protein
VHPQDVETSPGNKPAFIGVVPLRAPANSGEKGVKGLLSSPPTPNTPSKESPGLQVIRLPRDSNGDSEDESSRKPSADDMYECESNGSSSPIRPFLETHCSTSRGLR